VIDRADLEIAEDDPDDATDTNDVDGDETAEDSE